MRLEFLLEFSTGFTTPITTGQTPVGERLIADLTGGRFEGPKLKGNVRASGADWAMVGSDGVLRLDVRVVLETDDGAVIYMPYRARMVTDEALQKVLEEQSGATDYGDNYWFSQVQFETGDERYAWLNNKMAIGEGRLAPNLVAYRIYTVEPD